MGAGSGLSKGQLDALITTALAELDENNRQVAWTQILGAVNRDASFAPLTYMTTRAVTRPEVAEFSFGEQQVSLTVPFIAVPTSPPFPISLTHKLTHAHSQYLLRTHTRTHTHPFPPPLAVRLSYPPPTTALRHFQRQLLGPVAGRHRGHRHCGLGGHCRDKRGRVFHPPQALWVEVVKW